MSDELRFCPVCGAVATIATRDLREIDTEENGKYKIEERHDGNDDEAKQSNG